MTSKTTDSLVYQAEKLLYDLFYKGLEAGEDTTLQYQFEREPAYRARYIDRCIKGSKNELADILQPLITQANNTILNSLLEDLPNRKHSASDMNEDMNPDMLEVVSIRNKGYNQALTEVKEAIKKLIKEN